jgi:hypothetical protein
MIIPQKAIYKCFIIGIVSHLIIECDKLAANDPHLARVEVATQNPVARRVDAGQELLVVGHKLFSLPEK